MSIIKYAYVQHEQHISHMRIQILLERGVSQILSFIQCLEFLQYEIPYRIDSYTQTPH